MRYKLPIAAALLLPLAPAQGGEEPPDTNLLGLPADPIDEPMETDRPDFTEGTQTVPRGRFQLEFGYTFTYNDDGGVETRTQTVPEALLRVGIVPDFEFRLAWTGYERVSNDPGGDTDGLTDMAVGFKWRLLDQDGAAPNFAILGELSIPTGSKERTSDGVDPAIIFAWAYDLNERFSVAGNVGAGALTGPGETDFEASVSFAGGVSITDQLGAYIEYYGIFPDGGGDTHYADGGLTYQFTPNFQIDGRVGVGLNDAADDVFGGVGAAIRW